MRRKVYLVIIIACLAIAQLCAIKALDKRELILTAYKDTYHDFIIRPILGNLNSASGMPFDLTKADVQYVDASSEGGSHTYGRVIAEWSLHSNHTPVRVKIDAEPLTKVTDSTGTQDSDSSTSGGINYILYFPYRYNEVNETGTATEAVTGYMRVYSDPPYDSDPDSLYEYDSMEDPDWENGLNPISRTLSTSAADGIGLSTGTYPVRFMLASSDELSGHDSGTYNATVTITVEGDQ